MHKGQAHLRQLPLYQHWNYGAQRSEARELTGASLSSTSIHAEPKPKLASRTSDCGCAVLGPTTLYLHSTAQQGLADSSLC